MLSLADTQLRAVLLSHIASQLAEGNPGELMASGLNIEEIKGLGALSAYHLKRLAAMRTVKIAISVDENQIRAGLRQLGVLEDPKSLEVYFLRHGASSRMMRTFFKMGRKLTLQRRLQWGVRQPAGPVRLPEPTTRLKIFRYWQCLGEVKTRQNYYHLHKSFPDYTLSALEALIRNLENAL